MVKYIKENIEIFVETPLIIIGAGLLVGGLNYLGTDPRTGIALITLSVVTILIEKYVEKKDSEK